MKIRHRVLLVRKWFNHGNGIFDIGKWFIAFFGLASSNLKLTLIFGIAYVFLCLIFGWAYMKWFMHIDMEIDNKINPFIKEVRRKLNGKRFK